MLHNLRCKLYSLKLFVKKIKNQRRSQRRSEEKKLNKKENVDINLRQILKVKNMLKDQNQH